MCVAQTFREKKTGSHLLTHEKTFTREAAETRICREQYAHR